MVIKRPRPVSNGMKKTLNKKDGFTLIELLVVIAIIGILSSVVLVSLNQTRAKGKDSSAKVSMTNILTAAELYYDNHGAKYNDPASDFCTVDPEVLKLITAVNNNAKAPAVCIADANSYRVYTTLNNDKIFCVDSTGTAKEMAAIPTDEKECK